jgi:hypothetical protein
MKHYDNWKTDAPDDGCERCVELGRERCECAEDHQEEADRIADAKVEDDWLRGRGYDV